MTDPFYFMQMLSSISRKPYVKTMLSDLCCYHRKTYFHSLHVAMLSVQIGDRIGLSESRLYTLAEGALIHDIGKVKIPIRILDSPEPLTDDDFAVIRRHPLFSYDRIHNVKQDHSLIVELIGLMHHFYANGSGYPSPGEMPPGIEYDRTPLEAKIVCIADIYDAMVSVRSYKDSYSDEFAVSELFKMVNEGKADPKSVAILDELIYKDELILRHAGSLNKRFISKST